jgi:hypothetical protein
MSPEEEKKNKKKKKRPLGKSKTLVLRNLVL